MVGGEGLGARHSPRPPLLPPPRPSAAGWMFLLSLTFSMQSPADGVAGSQQVGRRPRPCAWEGWLATWRCRLGWPSACSMPAVL